MCTLPLTYPVCPLVLLAKLCAEREHTKYATAINIVGMYKKNCGAALDAFESIILGQTHTEKEADIILTTVHSAKGELHRKTKLISSWHSTDSYFFFRIGVGSRGDLS